MAASGSSPFGNTNGSVGPFEDEHDFILLPSRFGPAVQPILGYTRAKIVAGPQGAGKTLFLRRLNEHYSQDNSVLATASLKSRELDTDTVVRFSQLFPKTTNTEKWALLWDRAIHLSAATYIIHDHSSLGNVPLELRDELQSCLPRDFRRARTPRTPVEAVATLARSIRSRDAFEAMMFANEMVDMAHLVQNALATSRAIYLFVDAIDDSFRYAPTYWQQCQRGLFHAVMDTQQTEVEASKLHVVISIRDISLSSLSRSEHATRYQNADTIVRLNWTWEACEAFLMEKVSRLGDEYFRDANAPKTVEALFGRAHITNSRREISEPIVQYFLRHTRLSPRDIISLGNALIELSLTCGGKIADLSDAQIRDGIAKEARSFARTILAQAGNQILANAMPWSASLQNYSDFYTSEDEYAADGMVREICSILLLARGEVFSKDLRHLIEKEAMRRFGEGCHLVDTLWQNRLLGVETDRGYEFYSGAFTDDVAAPEADSYAFNSLLIDAIDGIRLTSRSPIYPSVGAS